MTAPARERTTATSAKLYAKACGLMPGGVNSPVRAFKAVGGHPPFIVRGRGCRIIDADGNEYLDYVGSWGPLIAGHSHPLVVAALREAAGAGVSFGAPTPLEIEMASEICKLVPSVERVRLVNSGTEATMSALRLARAATGRNKIIKMEGGYHGHVDSLLIKAGSGILTLGIPGTPGVSDSVAAETLAVPFNDLHAVEKAISEHNGEIAALILEPVAGNMGVVPPATGFLEGIRKLTEAAGVLLIFDEVMTGFRVAPGGAQDRFGIRPDLTTLGKIIGGGLPVGAYGGRADLMKRIAPEGDVYQAGTLSGNPLAMKAGLATLKLIQERGFYASLEERAAQLADGLTTVAGKAGLSVQLNRVGSMMTLFFVDEPVRDFASAIASNTSEFSNFHGGMLSRGIYLPPAQFEAFFLSSAHSESDIEETITAAGEVFQSMKSKS